MHEANKKVNKAIYINRDNLENEMQLDHFEEAINMVKEGNVTLPKNKKQLDSIPDELRKELNLPKDMKGFEIDFNVRLDTADLIIWFGLNDVNCIVATTILNVNRVALVKDRVMSQLLLQAIDIIEIINQVRRTEFKAYMALGLDKSMNAVSWGLIFTYVPFYRFMFLRIISVPSSTHRLFIIQIGI